MRATYLIVPVAAAAIAAAPAPAPPPALYTAQCAECHGAHLEGGAGPALKDPLVARQAPGDIYKIVRSGMPLSSPGSRAEQALNGGP